MLLKSLQLQGFKSFPDKTKLIFNKGLTAIVGPNGSGKSNISDSIRWVLGEQSSKTLRGSKMEDIIFSGTLNRKSQGFAKVSLVFDNKDRILNYDCDEIVISRKCYRSGESEYEINNKNTRLKNITELFMDTGIGKDGYSIIGQGKIAEIVGAKSSERREIFEEACGITKYRYKKSESEKNLKLAEENLLRLNDIYQELNQRINPLKIQADRAKTYLKLSEEKKQIQMTIWTDKLEKFNSIMIEQEKKLDISKHDYDNTLRNLDKIDKEMSDIYEKMQKCSSRIEVLRLQKESTIESISNTNSRISVCKNDILHNNNSIQKLNSDICRISLSISKLNEELNLIQLKKNTSVDQLKQTENMLLTYSNTLSSITEKANDTDTSYEYLSNEINKLKMLQSEKNMLKDNYRQVIVELENNIIKSDNELKSFQAQKSTHSKSNEMIFECLNKLKLNYEDHMIKINNLNIENKAIADQNQRLTLEYNDLILLEKEKKQRKSILQHYEDNFEGFLSSVKYILSQKDKIPGIHGTISELIDVSTEYSVAIETLMGSSLQNIIVDDEKSAKNIINILKDNKKGRVTLFPLNIIKGRDLNKSDFDKLNGFINIACNLVDYAPIYSNIIKSLIGRSLVAQDINVSSTIAKQISYKYRIATLDGQLINSGGSFTGGATSPRQGLLTRKAEIQSLTVELKKITEKKSDFSNKLELISTSLRNIESKLEDYKLGKEKFQTEIQNYTQTQLDNNNKLNFLNNMIDKLNVELSSYRNKKHTNLNLVSNIQTEITEIDENLELLIKEMQNHKLVKEKNMAEISQLEQDYNGANILRIELQKDIQTINEKINTNTNSILEQSALIDEYTNELQQIEFQNTSINKEILDLENQIEKKEISINQINTEISNIRNDIIKYELLSTNLRSDEKEYLSVKQDLSSELVRLEEKSASYKKEYDIIISKMWDKYSIIKSEAMEKYKISENDNISSLQKTLLQIKAEIKSLGSINIDAIEEHRDVSERHSFLTAQLKDIEKSKHELTKIILELTTDMKRIFMDSFVQINKYFNQIFIDLFGSGKGELRLNGDDPLECGIDILVQPPGKIIKNLMSLSGGEQAMVAICLYFSILKVNPSPFCILDEIEAALDDVNVSKYANYLKIMNQNTQFIMITHRRGTMEVADVLYGVTMQDEGVSKLLTLNLSDMDSNLMLK